MKRKSAEMLICGAGVAASTTSVEWLSTIWLDQIDTARASWAGIVLSAAGLVYVCPKMKAGGSRLAMVSLVVTTGLMSYGGLREAASKDSDQGAVATAVDPNTHLSTCV